MKKYIGRFNFIGSKVLEIRSISSNTCIKYSLLDISGVEIKKCATSGYLENFIKEGNEVELWVQRIAGLKYIMAVKANNKIRKIGIKFFLYQFLFILATALVGWSVYRFIQAAVGYVQIK